MRDGVQTAHVHCRTLVPGARRPSETTSKEGMMKSMLRMSLMVVTLGIVGVAQAGSDSDTTTLFRNSNQSSKFFARSYGYAVFPTIGKGGLGVGAAHGSGHVYQQGKEIGKVTMNQLSVGLQAGGEGYSQIIFFEDKKALAQFTAGNFEFSAGIGAIAVTTSASGSAGTDGSSVSASTDKKEAATAGVFNHGMVVFTIAKGGLMGDASVAGQKFSYEGSAVL
jgi:lipid-binding SYLF domain-containing protein